MESDKLEFKECKNCVYREHNEDLTWCLGNRLSFAFHNLLKEIPFVNKLIDENIYCHGFEMEE